MARKKASEPEEPEKVKLAFSQSLKSSNTGELLKRLKSLHKELAEIDQDAIETSSLDKVAKELVSNTLLLHKEKAVKAFLATCLVDILRLYAPEPPYTNLEVRDIFQFLTRQLKYVGDPTDAHASEYFYTLESLANVKSIVLICDLDQADEMMTAIFKQSFDIISSSTSKNVELNIADMLVQLLEEAEPIPTTVVDILLTQFLPKNVSLKPSAFSLVKDVCSAASDKLQRHVVQYFAEIISSTISGDREKSSDEEDSEDEAAKAKAAKNKKAQMDNLPTDFKVAHTLIRQISRSVPDLLLSVVPLIEKELEEEKVEFRKLATETLVAMCGEKIGQGDVAKRYPHVWRSLLKRCVDVNSAVRLALVNGLSKVWKEHQELSKDIEGVIGRLLVDADEKVRLATAQLFVELDYETAYHHVSSSMLKSVGERCRDSKASVRSAAMLALARLYNLAYQDIESKDDQVVKHFGWIPSALIDVLGLAGDVAVSTAIKATLDFVLTKHILPLPEKDDDESSWVDRFLVVYASLSADGQRKLLAHTRISERRPNWLDAYIQACEASNGGIAADDTVKQRLDATIRICALRLPEPEKAKEAMHKFAKADEKQLYKIMKTLMDPTSEAKVIHKNQKEALRRIEQVSASAVDTFTAFIFSASYFYINRSSISPLMKRLSNPKDEYANEAAAILTFVAKNRPAMFSAHAAELVRAVSDGSSDALAEVALHATAKMLKTKVVTSLDKKMSDRAKHYAKHGTLRQSKHAATILALDVVRSSACEKTISDLASSLATEGDARLPAALAALARFARFDRVSYEPHAEQITTSVLDILHKPLASSELADEDVAWFEDDELPPRTQARELCVRVLTNYAIAYAVADDTVGAQTVAEPIFQLLWELLVQTESDKGSNLNAPVSARMRLTSALAVMKMAPYACFDVEIAKKFLLLSRTAQDMSFEVRSGYIHKLLACLRLNRLKAARYNMLLFLAAHDPEDDLRVEVESYVRHQLARASPQERTPKWEHPFLRLIHMLAHHPDFTPDVVHDDAEELKVMAKYIQWYLEIVANQQNISYLLHLAQLIKTVRDRINPEQGFDRNLYTMSELAQYLITQHAKKSSWPLETRRDDIPMPVDIFVKIKNPADLKRVTSKAFLSSELLSQIQLDKTVVTVEKKKLGTVTKVKSEPKPKAAGTTTTTSRKRGSPSTAKSRPRKKKAVAKGDKWDPNANESDENDIISSATESDDDDDQADENKDIVGAGKKKSKSRSPAPPRGKKGTRTGLRNGSTKANGADDAVQRTKAAKGLAEPRKMRVRDNELEKMSSESEGEGSDAMEE